jgi:hypothetical protein
MLAAGERNFLSQIVFPRPRPRRAAFCVLRVSRHISPGMCTTSACIRALLRWGRHIVCSRVEVPPSAFSHPELSSQSAHCPRQPCQPALCVRAWVSPALLELTRARGRPPGRDRNCGRGSRAAVTLGPLRHSLERDPTASNNTTDKWYVWGSAQRIRKSSMLGSRTANNGTLLAA